MGSVSAVILGLCSQGDHVVAQTQLYSATSTFFRGVLPKFGVDVTFVDAADPVAFADAVVPGKTVLLLCETPTNPRMELVDLEAVGAIAGPIKVCDSTFAGPVIQRPLEHGFDLVLHSATKSLAGHNDATLGVIVGAEDLIQWVWAYHTMHGATASPFDAWSALRGVRTLAVRVRQQSSNAQRLAEFLEQHPAVAKVHYPGLDSHPQRDLAKRQMALGGGILSFEIHGGETAGPDEGDTCRRCGGQLIQRADDSEAVVRERLKVYHNATQPLVDYYRGRLTFRTVNGAQAADVVARELDITIQDAAGEGSRAADAQRAAGR